MVVVDQVGDSKSLMAEERQKNEIVWDPPCNREKEAHWEHGKQRRQKQ